jgi:hypothetical protein
MVDNGPNGRRYVAGMQGHKTTVYEGGIRSPLFICWPKKLKAAISNDRIVAHIDILPTVLDACNIDITNDLTLDGRSFLPLLTEKDKEWPDRNIFIQAHRGNKPVLYHNFAIRNQRWKMLHASGFRKEKFEGQPRFELYDMVNDNLEMNDLAEQKPEIVNELKNAYKKWFHDVSNTRSDNYAPPRIYIGTTKENPVVLTRQDWRQIKGAPWLEESNGYWMLYANATGIYDIRIRFRKKQLAGETVLQLNGDDFKKSLSVDQTEVTFQNIKIEKGNLTLKATLHESGKGESGPWQVDVIKKE